MMPKIFTGKAAVLNDLIKNVMKLAQQAERIFSSAAGVGSAFSSVCELVCSFFRALIGRLQTRWRERSTAGPRHALVLWSAVQRMRYGYSGSLLRGVACRHQCSCSVQHCECRALCKDIMLIQLLIFLLVFYARYVFPLKDAY